MGRLVADVRCEFPEHVISNLPRTFAADDGIYLTSLGNVAYITVSREACLDVLLRHSDVGLRDPFNCYVSEFPLEFH